MKKSKAKRSKKPVSHAPKKEANRGSVGIVPLGDRILIKPMSPEESGKVLASGILIPDTVDKDKKLEQGIVVAVGPGRRDEDGNRLTPDVAVGDRVMFSKPWNDPIKIDEVEYYLIPETDIVAIKEK